MHFKDAGDILFAIIDWVENAGALLQKARIDPHISQIAVAVVHDFEDQCRERGICRVGAYQLLVRVTGVSPCDFGYFSGRGEVVNDAVEESLDTDVLECRSAEDRVALHVDGAFAECFTNLIWCD